MDVDRIYASFTKSKEKYLSSQIKYRPDIDGLRALSVLGVIIYHLNPSILPGGYIGVDIFFVISGYLITSILLSEIGNNKFSIINFYERRARRLIPALALVLLVSSLFALYLFTPQELKVFGQSLVAVNLFASNIYFYIKSGYFDPSSEFLPLIHTWSLAVEEQFYIFFPLILIAANKYLGKSLIFVILSLIIFSFSINIFGNLSQQFSLNFYSSISRGWELLVGALIAFFTSKEVSIKNYKIEGMLSYIGLAGILFSFFYFDSFSVHPGLITLLPVISTALIIFCLKPGALIHSFLSLTFLVRLGLISYSAYLIHFPLIVFYRMIYGTNLNSLDMVALFVGSLVLAFLSWKYVEKPFRNKDYFKRKQIFSLTFISLIFLLSTGFIFHLSNGIPQRFSEKANLIYSSIKVSPERDSCHTDGVDYLKPENSCVYNADSKISWAVLGDSHGVELAYELSVPSNVNKKVNLNKVRHITKSGCPPIHSFDSGTPGCTEWLREALGFLEQNEDIDNVVLVWRHSQHMFGPLNKSFPNLPDQKPVFLRHETKYDARKIYIDEFISLVEVLEKANKNIFIINPIPDLPYDIEKYIYGSNIEDDYLKGISTEFYYALNKQIINATNQLKRYKKIKIINPSEIFCVDSFCDPFIGGIPIYFDDNHLNLYGARILSDYLLGEYNVQK